LLLPTIADVVRHHLDGTRFGLRVDDDGLITQGADGAALTWMDARVDGRPITQRAGKPVEVNALWISGLSAAARIAQSVGGDDHRFEALAERASVSFAQRFPRPDRGWLDVADHDNEQTRPNQVVAAAVLAGSIAANDVQNVLSASASLRTSIGLRSLAPHDAQYIGRHRGGPGERDGAYHQGTVWPWLLGPLVDLMAMSGDHEGAVGAVERAEPHLSEWGLGSVSETADGDAPHHGTGCPFQAWSVAEWLRARRTAP
jgi:predicted glycogen debranching enzyme